MEQFTMDIRTFTGGVMGTKQNTTAYEADAQYADIPN